ncbi:methyltransferase type 12 [Paraburkholderia sp. SOS3]|nr:methyltransferase type 12 [Paraburkholderia sp. SOS3]
MNEIDRLEQISEDFGYSAGVMAASIEYCYAVFSRHLNGRNILELGPAEGLMTELLLRKGIPLTVVEGSHKFCESISSRFPQVNVVHSLFEEYRPAEKYDNIILGHVLEHVVDPVALLVRVKAWLKEGGKVFAAVPNAQSIHRQAAVIMGLLACEDELNESDLHHGHRRVFGLDAFRECFVGAGLTIDVSGGYWLKPLSNGQIEGHWTPSMIAAFMELGERYPEIAGEIYVIASD